MLRADHSDVLRKIDATKSNALDYTMGKEQRLLLPEQVGIRAGLDG
jgi:hypothetical protein